MQYSAGVLLRGYEVYRIPTLSIFKSVCLLRVSLHQGYRTSLTVKGFSSTRASAYLDLILTLTFRVKCKTTYFFCIKNNEEKNILLINYRVIRPHTDEGTKLFTLSCLQEGA